MLQHLFPLKALQRGGQLFSRRPVDFGIARQRNALSIVVMIEEDEFAVFHAREVFEDRVMELKPCRDCGAMVQTDARGCPICARNLQAERMIAKYFWLPVVPALLLISIALVRLLPHR
ncbi:MAG: hypothetical protein WCB68_04570 [Pyrinomonadaceae bacterium]